MNATILRHLIAILTAVLASNMVTLALYFAGYPMFALAASAPVGLTVGMIAGHLASRERTDRAGR